MVNIIEHLNTDLPRLKEEARLSPILKTNTTRVRQGCLCHCTPDTCLSWLDLVKRGTEYETIPIAFPNLLPNLLPRVSHLPALPERESMAGR